MKATAELSLYPLDSNYESIVVSFIKDLCSEASLEVVSNGMSTRIFGTFENILDAVKHHLPNILKEHPTVLVMKLTTGHL